MAMHNISQVLVMKQMHEGFAEQMAKDRLSIIAAATPVSSTGVRQQRGTTADVWAL